MQGVVLMIPGNFGGVIGSFTRVHGRYKGVLGAVQGFQGI